MNINSCLKPHNFRGKSYEYHHHALYNNTEENIKFIERKKEFYIKSTLFTNIQFYIRKINKGKHIRFHIYYDGI